MTAFEPRVRRRVFLWEILRVWFVSTTHPSQINKKLYQILALSPIFSEVLLGDFMKSCYILGAIQISELMMMTSKLYKRAKVNGKSPQQKMSFYYE